MNNKYVLFKVDADKINNNKTVLFQFLNDSG